MLSYCSHIVIKAEEKPETNGSSCPDIVVTAPATSDSSEAAAPETEGESSKTEVHTNGDIGDSHGDSVTTPPNGEDVVSKKGERQTNAFYVDLKVGSLLLCGWLTFDF